MTLLFIISISFCFVAVYALSVYLKTISDEKRESQREGTGGANIIAIDKAMSGTDIEKNAEDYGYSCTR